MLVQHCVQILWGGMINRSPRILPFGGDDQLLRPTFTCTLNETKGEEMKLEVRAVVTQQISQ